MKTDERLETRGESQQVANAPGRNFPPGTPFEIGELSRLGNAITRSGMQFFASDLAPVINVTAPRSGELGTEVVSSSAMRKIRDLLIWLTRNESTETAEPAAEPSEPAAVDRPKLAYSLDEEDGYTLGDADEAETIQMAVNDWLDDHEFVEPTEIVIHLGTSVKHAIEHLRFVAGRIGDDVLGDLLENKLEDFCDRDGNPAFNFTTHDSDAFGLAIVEEAGRRFPSLSSRFTVGLTKDLRVRIVDSGGTWTL